MNRITSNPILFLLSILIVAAVVPCFALDDGVDLRLNMVPPSTIPLLVWQGGDPQYTVHRATTAASVYDPSSLVHSTLGNTWTDPAPGDLVFYQVRGRGTCWAATADAFVDASDQFGNYGGEDYLEAHYDPPERRTFLQFAVDDAIPPDAEVLSATLVMYQIGGNAGSAIQLRKVDEPWSEDTVAFRTAPDSSTGYGTTHNHSSTGRREWDVTTLMQQWTDGSTATLGLELHGWSEADYAIFTSREDVPSLLCVEWRTALESAAEDLRANSETIPKIEVERGVAISVDMELSTGQFTAYTAAMSYLENYGGLYGLTDARAETFLDRRVTDEFGLTTFIFGTRHENIGDSVEQIAVEAGLGGSFPLQTMYVYGATARLLPAVQKIREPANVVLTPREARLIVEETVTTGEVERLGEPFLEWFDRNLDVDQGLPVRPTWHVAFAVQDTPTAGWVEWVANIDAENGEVLRAHSVEIEGDRPGEKFKIRTANNTNKKLCWDTTTVDDPWFDENGALAQYPGLGGDDFADGINLFDGTHGIYHLYYDRFNRESWNGKGKKVRGMVDVSDPDTGGQYRNAYYTRGCNMMSFGDGWAINDVIGHEFTHGVVRWTAELEYINQSGALNESLADYFGSIADGDWEMAEDLYGSDPDEGPIRDMSNPPRFGDPDHRDPAFSGDLIGLRQAVSANGANKGNDYGGVHTNSGIPNKAFYLMTDGGSHKGFTVAGMGDTKTARLLYSALVYKFTKKTGFQDARDEIVRRARFYWQNGHYDFTVADVCDTINAWASVGYGDPDSDCNGYEDPPSADADGDGIPDSRDNCLQDSNTSQADLDGDGAGDVCDLDIDGDGDRNTRDNCILRWNANQADSNNDGIGDACDTDNDGTADADDNCPNDPNPDQADLDHDGLGDVCDPDDDNDGFSDATDNCPRKFNDQDDFDNDGAGDDCDNCLSLYNPSQANADNDSQGDACDTDDDNDQIEDGDDNCPQEYNPRQIDNDDNGVGMWCDAGELFMLQGFGEAVELDIFVQDNDLLNPIRFPIFPCLPDTTCPTVLPDLFVTQVDVDVQPAYLVRIVDDRGYTMAHAEYDPSGSYSLEFVTDHEYSYDAGGAAPVYEGRRYFVELLAPEGAEPQTVTGMIDVTSVDDARR